MDVQESLLKGVVEAFQVLLVKSGYPSLRGSAKFGYPFWELVNYGNPPPPQ